VPVTAAFYDANSAHWNKHTWNHDVLLHKLYHRLARYFDSKIMNYFSPLSSHLLLSNLPRLLPCALSVLPPLLFPSASGLGIEYTFPKPVLPALQVFCILKYSISCIISAISARTAISSGKSRNSEVPEPMASAQSASLYWGSVGLAPSGVQGQSPWSGNQGGDLKLKALLYFKAARMLFSGPISTKYTSVSCYTSL